MINFSLGDIVSIKSGNLYSGDRGMIVDVSSGQYCVNLWLIGKVINFVPENIHLVQSLGGLE